MPTNLRVVSSHVKNAAIFAVLSLLASLALSAKSSHGVNIKNFGKVNGNYFRGGQPQAEGFESLKDMGVRTIIDLQDGDRRSEESMVKSLGLNYINIPMDDHDRPSDSQIQKFLSVVQDQRNWPVFVHCAGGRHRTGAVTAVYRMTVDGWDVDRAYREMKDYDFYTRWGHGGYKEYVFDYSDRLHAAAGNGVATAGAAAQK